MLRTILYYSLFSIRHSLFAILYLLLAAGSLHSQDLKRLDKEYGFRSFKFETDIADCPNMKFLNGNGNYKYYTCKDDTLLMGEYPIKELTYCFYRGKLYFITITINGYRNSRGALRLLNQMYGQGKKFNEYSETHGWEGEKVKVGYNENTFNKNAIINIWSHVIADRIKAEEGKYPER